MVDTPPAQPVSSAPATSLASTPTVSVAAGAAAPSDVNTDPSNIHLSDGAIFGQQQSLNVTTISLPSGETKLRNTISTQDGVLVGILSKPLTSHSVRRAEQALQKYSRALQDLEKLANQRIGAITDNTLPVVQGEWVSWFSAADARYYSVLSQIEDYNGETAEPSAKEKLAAKKSLLETKYATVKTTLDQLESQLKELTNKPINKLQYQYYSKAVEDARKMPSEELDPLARDIIDSDNRGAPEFCTSWQTKITTVTNTISSINMLFCSLNVPDNTIVAFQASTPNNSFLGPQDQSQQQAPPAHGGGSLYQLYGKSQMPKFDGVYGNYPAFKAEWQNRWLAAQDDAWTIRMLNDNTPNTVNLSIYTYKHEAWEALDKLYANPGVVSDSTISEFMKKDTIKGDNDDQKIFNLRQTLLILEKDLRAVNETHQLTKNTYVLIHAIKMLPLRAQQELGNVRRAHDRTTAEELRQSTIFNAANGLPAPAGPAAEERAEQLWTNLKQFLQDQVDDILQYRAWSLSYKAPKTGGGTKPAGGGPAKLNFMDNKLSTDPAIKKEQQKFKKCPCCGGHHTWTSARNKKTVASDRLAACKKFHDMALEDRVTFVSTKDCCVKCLSWQHVRDNCTNNGMKCSAKDNAGSGQCLGPHHRMLHGSTNHAVINTISSNNHLSNLSSSPTLLCMANLDITSMVSTTVLLDSGSTVSCITHALAGQLGLQGEWSDRLVELAGKAPEKMRTKLYKLKCYLGGTSKQHLRELTLVGFDKLTSTPEPVDISHAYTLFPHVPPNSLDRPVLPVGLLLGQDHGDLQPAGGQGDNQSQGLRVMEIPFGTGWVLCGRHEKIVHQPPDIAIAVMQMRKAIIHTPEMDRMNFIHDTCANIRELDFRECEELGVNTPRKCNRCLNCANCSITDSGRTIQEQLELDLMRNNIWLDEEKRKLTVSYPVIGDMSQFRDNRFQAIQRATSLWNSLSRKGVLVQYNDQIQDYIDRKVWAPVTEDEIEAYKLRNGVVHYVSHHCVYNSHSLSTPLRVVVDSAVKNCHSGPSINEMYCKGPATLNSMFKVITRWRSYEVALIYDLKKAYHNINTTEKEFFTRLVVWKDKAEGPWVTYGHCTMGMGDKCSSTFLELGKCICAEKAAHIDPQAALQLEQQSYVDDTLGGGSLGDVSRMRGDYSVAEDGTLSFTGTIPQMLSLVGFRPKMIVISGDTDEALLAKVDKVLGLKWLPTDDLIEFKLVLTLHKKAGAGKTGPDLTPEDVSNIMELNFTKRIALQLSAQLYDPMGLICCYLVRFKMLLRDITTLKLSWDDPLPPSLQAEWRKLVSDTITAESIFFPRSLRVPGVTGRPEVIAYFDGSDKAFATVIYLRWKLESGGYHTALVTSKSRVTPQAGCTTPRSELNGLVVTTRILDQVLASLDVKPVRVTIIGDSTCTISSCQVNCASLNPYFANRVMEILAFMAAWGVLCDLACTEELPDTVQADVEAETRVDKLWHTPGELNIADWPTRGNVDWSNLDINSEWQNGPAYLRSDRATWPVNRDFIPAIPADEQRKKFAQMMDTITLLQSTPITDRLWEILDRNDNLLQHRGTLARLCHATREHDKFLIVTPPSAQDYEEADLFLKLLAMRDTKAYLTTHKEKSLSLFWLGGLCCTRGRLGTDGMTLWTGHTELVVLAPNSRYAELLTIKAHREDHRASFDDAWTRTRKYGFWIIQGRKLARKVVDNCQLCKVLRPVLLEQQIGMLPELKMKYPCSPFTHISCDYFGPMEVVDNVKKRVTMKVWPIIVCCLNTGSIMTLLATSYCADGFLRQFSYFTSIRGTPRYVYTDMGSNLMKIQRLVKESYTTPEPVTMNWEKVVNSTASTGVRWRNAPSGGQNRDGTAEACIKMLKKTLKHLTKGGKMTYEELQVLLAKASDIVNHRPLGVKHHGGCEPGLTPITPNTLLKMTRTDSLDIDPAIINDSNKSVLARSKFIDQCLLDWWHVWEREISESLVPLRRWRQAKQNLREKDVVLLKSKTQLGPGTYKLAIVLSVKKDQNGLVRTVTIGTRPRDSRDPTLPYDSKKLYQMEVPVQRLVLIVPARDLPDPCVESEPAMINFLTELHSILL